MNKNSNFLIVTESGGELVSSGQILRLIQRYYWAGNYCNNKRVLEVACGAGIGLGYIDSIASKLIAGDISEDLVKSAQAHYGDRINISQVDAEVLPYEDRSLDVVIIFEAIYYLENIERFLSECRRVLADGGLILIATANSALFDFNPSAYSTKYFNNVELSKLLVGCGIESSLFGGFPVGDSSIRHSLIRLAKKIAIKLNLIPRSMDGKRWIKRLVFGPLEIMPNELSLGMDGYIEPVEISASKLDEIHQVIYCVGRI